MSYKDTGEAFVKKLYDAINEWEPSWYQFTMSKPEFPYTDKQAFVSYIENLSPAFVVNGMRKGSWIENWGKRLSDNKISSTIQDEIIQRYLKDQSGVYPQSSKDLSIFGLKLADYAAEFKLDYITDSVIETAVDVTENVASVLSTITKYKFIILGVTGAAALAYAIRTFKKK